MKKKNMFKLFALLLICILLSACGGMTRSNSDSAPLQAPASDNKSEIEHVADEALTFELASYAMGDVEMDFSDDHWHEDEMPLSEDPYPPGGSLGTAAIPSERIIYRANVDIITSNFDETVTSVHRLTDEYDGFIEHHSFWDGSQGDQTNREAMFTIRIPTASYQDTVLRLDELGSVLYVSSTATNVSAQYTDIVSRLNALRTQEERILDLIDLATDISDLLALESELSEVIRQIEFLTTDRNFLDNQIAFSTIHLTVSEVTEEEEIIIVENPDIRLSDAGGAFTSSLETMRTFFVWLVISLSALLPWFAVVTIILTPIVIAIRRIIKKKRKLLTQVEM